jgi:hypothetical protein
LDGDTRIGPKFVPVLIPAKTGSGKNLAYAVCFRWTHNKVQIDRIALVTVQANCHAASYGIRNCRIAKQLMAGTRRVP